MKDDFQGEGDRILEQQQQFRRVIWATAHFMNVTFLLNNSDCVALLPKRMAQQCAKAMNLKILPLPLPFTGFTVSMVWHQSNTNNLAHQWLRQQIIEAVKDI